MPTKQKQMDVLLRQTVIIADLVLILTRGIQSSYRRKHVGANWEEWLVAFAYWREDTVLNPIPVLTMSKRLGIPEGNTRRAVATLVEKGILRKVGRAYGRDLNYLSARLYAAYVQDIITAIIEAGEALKKLK